MAAEEMDGDVYLLTGQALKWHCIGTCLPVCVPLEISGCAKGART